MVEEYFKAIKDGELMKVEQMIKRNPSLVNAKDESGMSGIAVATYYGQPKVASLLVSRGATLNVFEAAMIGDLAKVRDLVEHEISLENAYSADGFTALHLAAFFGQSRVVEFLVERGANVDAVSANKMKVTPVHSAAAHNQVEICEALLSNGADVNAKQENNFTPLHEAAQNGSMALAKLLLGHGAQVNAQTDDSRTPLDMTKESGPVAGGREGREEVAKMLVNRGGKPGK